MTAFTPAMMNPSSTITVWEGASSGLTNVATAGRVSSASYRVTEDAIHFASGVVSSREETLPLWAVRDIDLVQSMTQRARGVSDLTLKIDPSAGVYGQDLLVLKSIRDAKQVRDLILNQANQVRSYWNQRGHEMDMERQRASATNIYAPPQPPTAPAPVASGGEDLLSKLTRLGEMKQAGLLTDEEFVTAKTRLLT